MKIKTPPIIAATLFWALHSAMTQAVDVQPPNAHNNVYFGDVHVHTSWSFDGFTNGSKTTPMDAYANGVQIVKGWLDASGKQHEKIYDVVWSGDRKIGADGKLPAVIQERAWSSPIWYTPAQ